MTNVQDFLRLREDARVLIPTLAKFALVTQDTGEISWEHFNSANIPQYNVPLGFDVLENQRLHLVAYHEPGHEEEERQSKQDPLKAHRRKFLTLIGETRSWDALKAAADALTTAGQVQAGHDADPGEWWADAFANAIAGRPQVGPFAVQNVDPLKLRAFFQGLIGIVPAPPVTQPTQSWPIIWKPSPYFSRGWWNPPTNGALHSSASTLAGLLDTFTNPNSSRKVSAHFTIDGFTEQIFQHVDMADRAWHAIDANEFAYGWEHIDGKAWGVHPEVTYAMSAFLIRTKIVPEHRDRFGLKLEVNDDVFGPHSRWVATACPAALDWGRIITEAGGSSDMPTEAEYQAHLVDERNTIVAMKDVLARLAHAGHPFKIVNGGIVLGEHTLDPNIRGAMKKLDAAIARQTKNAKYHKKRTAASARAGHGRGKSKDVE